MNKLLTFVIPVVFFAGCTTRELDTVASNTGRIIAYPITGPANAIVQNAPISENITYTYWKADPATNTYTPFTTSKRLTKDEQLALGVLQTPETN